MSSLADRLDAARRAQVYAVHDQAPKFEIERAERRNRRGVDPFAGVKDRVHQALVESLGPRLYDPHLAESELASK